MRSSCLIASRQDGFVLILLSPADTLLRAPIRLLGLVPMLIFASFLAMTGRLKPAVPAPQANDCGGSLTCVQKHKEERRFRVSLCDLSVTRAARNVIAL